MRLVAIFGIILPILILSSTLGILGSTVPVENLRNISDDSQCDYLIITTDSLKPYVEPLANWKSQRGLYTAIETVEDITENYEGSDTQECVRNCIIHYHNQYNTTWVVLAGRNNRIPTRSVHTGDAIVGCDYYFSNLGDNWVLQTDGVATIENLTDWEPDVYVGRLPASTTDQMQSLVARIIEYESNPPVGPWMQNALFAGTHVSFDSDANGNNILDDEDYIGLDTNRNHHWLIENILPSDWTSTVLGEAEGVAPSGYPYDLPINQSTLIDSINNGASILMTDAHGSPVGMYRSLFTNDVDGDGLFDYGTDTIQSEPFLTVSSEFNTNGKYCFSFLAACSTGTFDDGSCLTEYMTRTCGIGCIGASHSAWYDSNWYDGQHLGWFAQGLSTRVWEQILLEGNNHPGIALSLAKADYALDCENWNGDWSDEGRTLAQFNLQGDPEVPIWIKIPEQLTSEIAMDNSSRTLNVKVLVDHEARSDAVVTVVGSSFYHRCTTNVNGEAVIQMPDLDKTEDFNITISKKGYLPCQETVGVSTGSANSSLWSYTIPIVVSAGIVIVAVVIVVKIKRT